VRFVDHSQSRRVPVASPRTRPPSSPAWPPPASPHPHRRPHQLLTTSEPPVSCACVPCQTRTATAIHSQFCPRLPLIVSCHEVLPEQELPEYGGRSKSRKQGLLRVQ